MKIKKNFDTIDHVPNDLDFIILAKKPVFAKYIQGTNFIQLFGHTFNGSNFLETKSEKWENDEYLIDYVLTSFVKDTFDLSFKEFIKSLENIKWFSTWDDHRYDYQPKPYYVYFDSMHELGFYISYNKPVVKNNVLKSGERHYVSFSEYPQFKSLLKKHLKNDSLNYVNIWDIK